MKQKKKENKPVTFHYQPEHALSVIYWSLTLFLICLCVIISCETQTVTISAILCGVAAVILMLMPMYRRVAFKHNGIWIYALIPGHSSGCHYTDIEKVAQRENHFVIYAKTGKTWQMYINKKRTAEFINELTQRQIQLVEE